MWRTDLELVPNSYPCMPGQHILSGGLCVGGPPSAGPEPVSLRQILIDLTIWHGLEARARPFRSHIVPVLLLP